MTAEDVVIWAKAELQKNGTERYLPKITKRWYCRASRISEWIVVPD